MFARRMLAKFARLRTINRLFDTKLLLVQGFRMFYRFIPPLAPYPMPPERVRTPLRW